MAKDKIEKVTESADKSKDLEALIDAQLDEIVVGGWSRTVFNRVNPY